LSRPAAIIPDAFLALPTENAFAGLAANMADGFPQATPAWIDTLSRESYGETTCPCRREGEIRLT
jgi:hypothetical protein